MSNDLKMLLVILLVIFGMYALVSISAYYNTLDEPVPFKLEQDDRFIIGYEMGYAAGSRNCIDSLKFSDRWGE